MNELDDKYLRYADLFYFYFIFSVLFRILIAFNCIKSSKYPANFTNEFFKHFLCRWSNQQKNNLNGHFSNNASIIFTLTQKILSIHVLIQPNPMYNFILTQQ